LKEGLCGLRKDGVKEVDVIIVLKLGIGIGIGFLTVESESDESVGIGRIGSVTQVFLAEALFCSQKVGKN